VFAKCSEGRNRITKSQGSIINITRNAPTPYYIYYTNIARSIFNVTTLGPFLFRQEFVKGYLRPHVDFKHVYIYSA